MVNLLGVLLGDGWVCMIMMEIAETGNSTFVYAKIVPITKNAVQHGVKIKMSPTQNSTILKCIAMDRTKRREGAKNRSSLDVS